MSRRFITTICNSEDNLSDASLQSWKMPCSPKNNFTRFSGNEANNNNEACFYSLSSSHLCPLCLIFLLFIFPPLFPFYTPPSISPSSYIFFFPSVSLDLSYPVPPFCRLHQFLPFAFRSFPMNFSKEKFDCGILSRRSFFHFHRFSVPL